MKKSLFFFLLLFSFTTFATPQQPLTLVLDWFVNPTHGPILIAQEKGFFATQGLNVNIITPADPTDTAKWVAIGKADIGISSDPELALLQKQGLPLIRIGTLINHPLDVLIISKSANVKTLADIKGKTIAYPIGGIDKVILSTMLQHVGLNLNDVTLINVHYSLVQALLSKKVDGITGAMRDFELIEVQEQNFPVTVFYPEDYGVKNYAELNYIANRYEKNDPRITAFLLAIKQATAFIQTHPNQSWQMIIKAHPELNNALNEKSWEMTYPLFSKNA
jgi:putative hydroxymethylpyrimidine transport system substrate-binding protein